MKIGLTGDTHNNLKNISIICEIFNEHKVDLVVHTGDITLPKSLDLFQQLSCKLIGVFGNNDQGEITNLKKICEKHNFDFENGYKKIFLLGVNIFIVHDPNDIKSNFYGVGNMILHGHTHRYRNEIKNKTYIFNPGECAGILKGKNQVGIISLENKQMDVINF